MKKNNNCRLGTAFPLLRIEEEYEHKRNNSKDSLFSMNKLANINNFMETSKNYKVPFEFHATVTESICMNNKPIIPFDNSVLFIQFLDRQKIINMLKSVYQKFPQVQNYSNNHVL